MSTTEEEIAVDETLIPPVGEDEGPVEKRKSKRESKRRSLKKKKKSSSRDRHPLMQLAKKPARSAANFTKGSAIALLSMTPGLSGSEELRKAEKQLLKQMIWQMAKIYGLTIGLLVVFWPVTIAVFMASPGMILNLFQLAPLWSLNLAADNKTMRTLMQDVFHEELERLDPELAEQISEKIKNASNKSEGMYNRLRMSMHFTSLSLVVNMLGFLPFGTVFASIGQSILIAERFGWKMLDPYVKTLDSYSEKKAFMHTNYFLSLGYCLPMQIINIIPIVNGFAIVYAQAGAARLLTKCKFDYDDK